MTEKTCMNCEYRQGGFRYGRCLKSGQYPDLQRQYTNVHCDRNFSGWKPRRAKLVRLWDWLASWVTHA